jgi:hypothetical protein
MDRFMMKILVNYPSREEELRAAGNWNTGFNSRRLEDIDIRPIPVRLPYRSDRESGP